MNKTMNNTVNSNMGQSISPVKRVTQAQENEADLKIDDAIKLKEQQTNSLNPLRQSDFTAVKYEQLEVPTKSTDKAADVSLVELDQEEVRLSQSNRGFPKFVPPV